MIKKFLNQICSVESCSVLHNQYRDDLNQGLSSFDKKQNLEKYLQELLAAKPQVMIVGESAGHNGAKRTGLHLLTQAYYSSRIRNIATDPYLLESNTAKTIEQTFNSAPLPLAFNIVPFFTHPDGEWTTNRTPSKIEIMQLSIFAQMLYETFRPKTVLAMGRLAEMGLNSRGIKNCYIRHPSMGGKAKFIKSMNEIG